MGKKGKKKRSDLKKMKKVAIKYANRAKYDAWRDSGDNSKSFRARKRSKRKGSVEKGKHLVTNCGNIGCQRCNPIERKPEKSISIKELTKLIKLPAVNKQIPGGNQKKKQRGGIKVAA